MLSNNLFINRNMFLISTCSFITSASIKSWSVDCNKIKNQIIWKHFNLYYYGMLFIPAIFSFFCKFSESFFASNIIFSIDRISVFWAIFNYFEFFFIFFYFNFWRFYMTFSKILPLFLSISKTLPEVDFHNVSQCFHKLFYNVS